MEILLGVFGFFALLSAVALVKFQGNPVFVFSLLLCSASLVWLIRLNREESRPSRSGKKGRASKKR